MVGSDKPSYGSKGGGFASGGPANDGGLKKGRGAVAAKAGDTSPSNGGGSGSKFAEGGHSNHMAPFRPSVTAIAGRTVSN